MGPSWRVFILVATMAFWALGYAPMAGLAYVLPGWRHIQAAISVPDVFFFIVFAV